MGYLALMYLRKGIHFIQVLANIIWHMNTNEEYECSPYRLQRVMCSYVRFAQVNKEFYNANKMTMSNANHFRPKMRSRSYQFHEFNLSFFAQKF